MTSKEILKSMDNPATSFWLKKALQEMSNRDVLDAAFDADLLLCFCKTRLNESGMEYMEHCLSENVKSA